MQSQQNVQVMGAWHLGSVVGACLAKAGHKVTLWDQNETVSKRWEKGNPPLFEPQLEELAKTHWGKNLFWSKDLASELQTADWIIFAYDTPINEADEVELDQVEEGVKKVLSFPFPSSTNFLFTSQLPVGTSRRFGEWIKAANKDWRGHVLYQPENLRLGNAIQSLEKPDRVALGYDTTVIKEREALEASFRNLFRLPQVPIDSMNLESAEMVKHALNSFLAACVVFGNELSEICEKTGADAWDVVKSLKKDSRVGMKAPLFPGLGFAGGTLARDLKTLSRHENKQKFFSQLYTTNTGRNDWVISALEESLGDLRGKRILLLGVTYKPQTSTVRRSPAIDISKLLYQKGAAIRAMDPMADMNELSEADRKTLPMELEKDTLTAFQAADGVVLVTEWPQFLELDWEKLGNAVSHPVLIDTKNFLNGVDSTKIWRRIIPGKARGTIL